MNRRNSIWLETKIQNTETLQKIDSCYFCFCYIKPYVNKTKSEEIFSKLEIEVANYRSKGEIFICGDFNARTGGLQNFIQHDTVNDTFSDCPLPENVYEPDISDSRNQLDETSNLQGQLLTDICKTFRLSILNGRFLGDSLGYFTFFNSNGSSTVDYICWHRVSCITELNTLMYYLLLKCQTTV